MRVPAAAWLAAAAVLATGCGTAAPAAGPDAGPAAGPPAAPATRTTPRDTAGTAAMEAAFWARRDADRARFVQADVDFMTGMIGHHAQALVMSAMAPTHAGSSSLRTLAARIENAQEGEIASMQEWLRRRDQPVPEVHIEGTRLMIHGPGGMDHGAMDHGGDHAMMPGMLTQAQLDALDAARGDRFDRLFLHYMIGHHRGAVVMVEDLFAVDGAALEDDAFKLASDIQVDQRTEIARMQRMLDALGGPPPDAE